MHTKSIALFLGPIIACMATALMWFSGAAPAAAITLGITLGTVIWWIFEPIPIPVTSLLPLALLPMFGVLTPQQLGAAYGHPLVLLLLGGFLLATALENSGAHKRIALTMVKAFGGNSSRRLVFGFMAASAVLSMWISNTATVIMLLPVATAVLASSRDKDLSTPLLLAIAWGASIGGIGTPIGTPPNIVFMGIYEEVTGSAISFATWMSWAIPIALVLFPIAGFWVTRRLRYVGEISLPEIGTWTLHERRVFIVFALTALAWITRTGPFGGWAGLLGLPYTNDAIVAFLGVVTLFLIPNGKGAKLLDWEAASTIPWGMLLLFGAGISIASAFMSSGLSTIIGEFLKHLSELDLLLMIATICISVTFLTEVTSNTATTTLLMPIMAAAALAAGTDPKLFMIPAALSASCAFMLPVATPPNLIVFSTGKFTVATMAREGFAMNLFGVAVISLMIYFILG